MYDRFFIWYTVINPGGHFLGHPVYFKLKLGDVDIGTAYNFLWRVRLDKADT